MNKGKPLNPSKRLEWIDAVRGLAILGIFMVNVPAFNAPFFLYGGEDYFWDTPLDRFVQGFIDIFFQASFYTLFSILFGFGMEIIRERLIEKKLNAPWILLKRLVVLVGFGIPHAFLLWHGDILLSYGVIGLFLFLFFKRESYTLLVWASVLITLPALAISWYYYQYRELMIGYMNEAAVSSAFQNYSSESLINVLSQNYNDWIYGNGDMLNLIFLTVGLLPLFLIGMYIARKKWLHDIKKNAKVIKRAWVISLLIFAVFKAGPYLYGNPPWFSYLQDSIGGPASAIFYLTSFTLLYRTGKAKKLISSFSAVGRMSFSHYIFQSIICFFVFYGPGLGFYGDVRPHESLLFVVTIFSIQIVISHYWLRHFRYGPLEWAWRSLTYGERQPFKRNKEEVRMNE